MRIENMNYQNSWGTAQVLLKKIYIFATINQEERAFINNLKAQLKKLENDQQNELQVGRRKEIIKLTAGIPKKTSKAQ